MRPIQGKAFARGFLSVFGLTANTYYRDHAYRHIQRQVEKPYWVAVGDYLRGAMYQMNSEVEANGKKEEANSAR